MALVYGASIVIMMANYKSSGLCYKDRALALAAELILHFDGLAAFSCGSDETLRYEAQHGGRPSLRAGALDFISTTPPAIENGDQDTRKRHGDFI